MCQKPKVILWALTLLWVLFSTICYGQNNTSCGNGELEPICTSVGLSFIANTGIPDASVLDPGNNYGCLATQPNPAWYYLEIATPGSLSMSLSAPRDIDFIIYGPFNNINAANASCGNYGNGGGASNGIVDCSYSATANETPEIPNAQVGQVYVMLITNYANTTQNLSLTAVGGFASTNCSIVTDCTPPTYTAENIAICSGETASVDVGLGGTAPFNVYYTSSLTGVQSSVTVNSTTAQIQVSEAQTITIDSVVDAVCSTTLATVVTVTEQSNPTITSAGNFRCGPGSVSLSATASSGTVQWYTLESGGSAQGTGTNFNTPSIATTTTYYAQAFLGSCSSNRVSVVASVYTQPTVDLGQDQTICATDSIVLNAGNPGFNYNWSNGSGSREITVNQAGTYHVLVSDNIGCSDRDTIVVTVQANPVVDLRADTAICFGDVLILDAGNSTLTHAWSTNETTQTIEVSSSNIYSVMVTDALGCTGFDVFTLTVNELPDVSLSGPSDVCLRSGLAELTESPPGGLFSGQAITSTGFYDPSNAGLIPDQTSWAYYTYTDENNCINKDSSAITLRLEPDPIIGMPDTIVCNGETTTLFVSSANPAIFEWFDLGTNNGIANGNSYGSTTGGTYYVHATNAYCSAYSDTVLVELVTPVLELTTDMLEETILEGESVTITAQSPNVVGYTYSYEWLEYSTGNQTSGPNWTVSPDDSTFYLVTATLRGCPIEAEILIGVTQRIKMPDAFTPNGDGINDEFLIGNIEDYPAAQVTIYNRWGNILHETFAGSYKSEPWNGMASGQELPVGVYYYTVNPNDDRVNALSGSIMLMK